MTDIDRIELEAKVIAFLENGVYGKGSQTDVYPDWVYEARSAIKHQNQNIPWLPDLMKILGWQGGTVHQALNAVSRLVEFEKRMSANESKRQNHKDTY